MLKNKKALVMSVLCAIASVGFVVSASAAEQTMHGNLDEVVVEGRADVLPGGMVSKTGSVGLIGNKDVMDVPFSTTSITQKQMETFGAPNMPLDNALVGVPSIRQAGSVLHNDFTIRGFRANGTSTYINGVHGVLTQFNFPTYPFDQVDVLSGPNSIISGSGVQYESSTAGGIINMHSKKAGEEPVLKYKQTFSGKGVFGEYLDAGQRFGKDKAWGVRINTEVLHGETSVDETDMSAKGIFVNLDHRDDNSKTNLFTGYRDIDIDNGMRWFKIGPAMTKFPGSIDGSKNYAFKGMTKGGYGFIAVLNHEQKLNDDWKVFFNGGYSKQKLNHNVMGGGSSYTINDDAGNFDLKYAQSATPQKSFYAQFGTNGKFETGAVKHDLTLSVDKAWRNRNGSTNAPSGTVGTGNIYTGILNQTSMPVVGYSTYKDANQTSIWGVSLIDSLEYEKWGAILGIHKHQGEVTTHNASGSQVAHSKSDATSPSYALTYKPNENITLYGSHAENFDVGQSSSDKNCLNKGEILSPAKTKQNEIGVKYQNKGFLSTLAFYDIKQANNINEYVGSTEKFYFRQNGEVRHKGIELSFAGQIAPKWNATAGVAYMNAKYEKTTKGAQDGVQESGQPKWNGAVSLEYQADDNFSVIGRALYTGSSPLYNTNKTKHFYAPSYTTFDLGVNYKTKVGTVPTKLSLMCYNLFDKDYWMVSRGDQIYASVPRTFFVSAEFTL